jgi:hypothetical protein
MKQETLEELKDLAYYKANAEEDYLAVPISVLRYISQLEQQENTYSEEDMREMYNKSCGLIGLGELKDQTENNNRFRELIEKIKNK